MKKFNYFLAIAFCIISIFSITACNKELNSNIATKEQVVDVFMENGEYESGNYYIRKYNDLDYISFSYSFSYSPSYNLFHCSLLVTTYGNINSYKYASATFSWGDFKNALFSAYNELDSIAKIEFEYDNIEFVDGLGESYNYSVISNTYNNLNENDDIEKYASDCYDCLQQVISFARTTLSNHNLSYNLW